MHDAGYAQTSEVWPSRIFTSELGMSHGKDVEIVEMSIGSGPIQHIHKHILNVRKQYTISHLNRMEDDPLCLCARERDRK